MPKAFKRGGHVSWNSEAGRVRGTIIKKVISDVTVVLGNSPISFTLALAGICFGGLAFD
jgi:hypothetical protein